MSEEFEVRSEEERPEKENGQLKKELFEWLQILVFCAVTAVVIFNCVARVSRVDGQSMDYTLRHNELLLVWSLGYSPKQGDIVIVNKTTADFLGEHAIVKRIIATGGQTVDIDYARGFVYVDGELLDEPYIAEEMYLPASPHMMHPGLRAAPEDPHPLSLSLSASCLPPTPACSLLSPVRSQLKRYLLRDSRVCPWLPRLGLLRLHTLWGNQVPSLLECSS